MVQQTLHDELLIERCQRGDALAMDELLCRYRSKAFMYALKMTKHVEEADDLVVDAFIRVYKAISRYRAKSSFSTWMFRILKNCYLDFRKKRKVNVVCGLEKDIASFEGVAALQPIDESDSPFELASKAETKARLRTFIDRLPATQRELILMYYQGDLIYDEVAKKLSTPTGTIKSRLYRAKANLRGLMMSDVDPFLSKEI